MDKKLLSCAILVLLCLRLLGESSVPLVEFKGESIEYFGQKTLLFSTSETYEYLDVLDRISEFKSVDSRVPNLGVTNQNHWIVFDIVNEQPAEEMLLKIAYPVIDELDVYLIGNDGELLTKRLMGESLPFSSRLNSYKDYVVPFNQLGSDQVRVLLRLKSGEQLMVPMKIQTDAQIGQDSLVEHIFFGIYIGVIIVMFLYNLFIFFSTRDRAYLFYVVYILTVGLTQGVLQGFAFKFIWPNTPEFALDAVYIVGALSGVAVLLFVREFLKIRATNIWFDNYLLILGALDILALGIAFSGEYNLSYSIINTIAGLGSLSILGIAIYFTMKGMRSAMFFLFAWSIFLVSVILYVLKDFGLIIYNDLTDNILMAGSSIEVVLLSLAIADRINVLKQENEKSQIRELEAVKENEKLVTEQNIVLEQKVTERTTELSSANSQLNKAMDELKQTQGQLVNAEKMASLGQLTAGIAHEINNPINFVTASVNPLKNDLDDLKSLIGKYDEVLKEKQSDELLSIMDKYKTEIDIDFTIQEMDDLLQGVEEGARRTAEIVQGLKNFSRLDESDSKMASIHECLGSTLVVLRNIMKDRVELEKDFDEEVPEIECFPGKLNQAFSNIIVNAIQAMKDTENPKISIKTENLENDIRITISDNGPGIPDEIKDKIFDPFFTTKDVGEGTGLGLSIVYSIVEQHHGTLIINSEMKEGTSFIFTLPKSK